jgi:hypothetical protein
LITEFFDAFEQEERLTVGKDISNAYYEKLLEDWELLVFPGAAES